MSSGITNAQYEAIINTKWTSKPANTETVIVSSGGKVPVIQQDVFITDRNGTIVSGNPSDANLYSNLLNFAWKLWIIPEIKRRKAEKLVIPHPLNKIFVLFDAKNDKYPTIKLNDEYELSGSVRRKNGVNLSEGDPITFDLIADFGPIIPPSIGGKPIAFFWFQRIDNQVSVYLDFRPNNENFKLSEWENEGEWLANAYVETLLTRQFGHLALVIPQLSRYDIPLTIGLKPGKMEKICAIIENGIENDEFNEKLSRILTRNEVESLIDNWLTLDSFDKIAGILKDVSKSFRYGIYGGVITLLMSQIEGIITDELVSKNEGLRDNGKTKFWDTRIEDFEKIVRKEQIGPLTTRILDGVIHFLNESNLYESRPWISANENLNRHASLHGMDSSFNTRANAIRMILLFDAFYWIFLALSDSRRENNDTDYVN